MRTAKLERNTRETQISVSINLDGTGRHSISTGIPFLNHMMEILARHSLIDLEISAVGDLDVDDHHTVEDLGIVLGTCIDQALGDRKGIRRYGFMLLPMDESLCQVALDLGGRPYMVYNVNNERKAIKTFDVRLVEEFFRALMTQARMNLHINHLYGDEVHHAYESVFKAFARALRMAVEIDPREGGVPSSKGVI
ncbi:MAG: imidazoleglycerol-phosphate dehydratase HisB [Kiritimatiellae bacterium]|nr:imidazoleglycerol-phosphate dehydratase HisB [Kiritimatiellia bacterium]